MTSEFNDSHSVQPSRALRRAGIASAGISQLARAPPPDSSNAGTQEIDSPVIFTTSHYITTLLLI
jgi:hypothetical protein